uniref:Uncharacterized protein n=1 Tax=Romanomermis culicivorax TaxID=13658 RepID=A0A915J1G3_ROMCU
MSTGLISLTIVSDSDSEEDDDILLLDDKIESSDEFSRHSLRSLLLPEPDILKILDPVPDVFKICYPKHIKLHCLISRFKRVSPLFSETHNSETQNSETQYSIFTMAMSRNSDFQYSEVSKQ